MAVSEGFFRNKELIRSQITDKKQFKKVFHLEVECKEK